MKKIFLLLLCLAISLPMLVACDGGEIGDYEYPGYVPKNVPLITLDFYVIVGDATQDLAIDSVARMLSQYTETKFKTKLNVHYIKESEYVETLKADIQKNDDAKADIVFINSYELAKELIDEGKLEDISSFYDPSEEFIKELKKLNPYYEGKLYGRLNTLITPTLIEASKINGKLYTVPNDHVVGEYSYLLIKEDIATSYNFSPAKLKACTTLEDETLVALKAAMEADGKVFADSVYVVSGDYSDKSKYESEGYICNILNYPTVDTSEAFSSAFAIVKGTQYPHRAMEVLYLLNTDSYFRNLLQYGVEGINYVKDDDGTIIPHTEGDGVYSMNMLHTGNVFLLEYSVAWTETMKNVGISQNKDSVVDADAPSN